MPRRTESAAQAPRRLTSMSSYAPDTAWDAPVDDPAVLTDLVVNDMARFPWFYQRSPRPLPRVPPPRGLPPTTAPAVAVRCGTRGLLTASSAGRTSSRLLHLSAGVVRTTERPFGQFLFRAAGSAGGRFPLELHVAVPEGLAVPAGLHWYDPRDHALVRVGPPPLGDAPAIVVTGIPWRTGWRYRERGWIRPVACPRACSGCPCGQAVRGVGISHRIVVHDVGGLTCVGVPEYPSAAGGPPGAPTAVRMVTPRMGNL